MSKNETNDNDMLFLGLDSSTQGLKATLIDTGLNIAYESAVNFDRDLPEFKTEGGAHRAKDGLTVTSPPLMWVAALDLLLTRMKDSGCALDRVSAISGSGQQHGSVWFRNGARQALRGLDARRTLREQLSGCFSVENSPIWMDSSTTDQCRALEAALGGPQAVADLTGSRAYERFTGNQIAKIFQTRRAAYDATERIALVSSFIASLLIGDYAPIDASDGSGMNLMDLRRKAWAPAALEQTAAGLAGRLGPIVPSHAVAGPIHPFHVERFGFNPTCLVIAFSGDNPNSLAGLRLQKTGDIAISLGTSDTVFGSLSEPRPSGSEGHIFANPVDPDAYMAMICLKNGSLTREYVRDLCAENSWKVYAQLMEKTMPGNGGNIGFYIRDPEITPPILKTGVYRFDPTGKPVSSFAPANEVRAVLEGQFLSLRLHGERLGIRPHTILATGGASVDRTVLRVIADVFGVSVYTAQKSDSASLGAAYRARHGWVCAGSKAFVAFAEVMQAAPPFQIAMQPDNAANDVYTRMLPRYAELEQRVCAG
jgi:xylulokinase